MGGGREKKIANILEKTVKISLEKYSKLLKKEIEERTEEEIETIVQKILERYKEQFEVILNPKLTAELDRSPFPGDDYPWVLYI
ncbi:MAG: hypothetical protein ACTSP1_14835 [Candidatus Freyarchaeota archaeon]